MECGLLYLQYEKGEERFRTETGGAYAAGVVGGPARPRGTEPEAVPSKRPGSGSLASGSGRRVTRNPAGFQKPGSPLTDFEKTPARFFTFLNNSYIYSITN